MITLLVSFSHCVVWLLLWYLLAIVLSDYSFGIFCPLCCLITPLVSFVHCVVWLLLWYLLTIVLSVLLWFTGHCVVWLLLWYLLSIVLSDYPFGIFWPLYCLSFFDLQILITPLVSFVHCVVWLLLWYLLSIVLSDYSFGIF